MNDLDILKEVDGLLEFARHTTGGVREKYLSQATGLVYQISDYSVQYGFLKIIEDIRNM